MPRTIAAWMALIAALAVSIAALRGPTEGWAVAILTIEGIGLVSAIAWGIVRRSVPTLAFALIVIVGLIVVESPAVRRRLAIDALLVSAHDWIAPDREGEARLPRSSFDETYSRWVEAHPARQVHDVTLDDEQVTLHWFEPTLGPFLMIAGRLLALLPAALVAVILTMRNRRRSRWREDRPCPA